MEPSIKPVIDRLRACEHMTAEREEKFADFVKAWCKYRKDKNGRNINPSRLTDRDLVRIRPHFESGLLVEVAPLDIIAACESIAEEKQTTVTRDLESGSLGASGAVVHILARDLAHLLSFFPASIEIANA